MRAGRAVAAVGWLAVQLATVAPLRAAESLAEFTPAIVGAGRTITSIEIRSDVPGRDAKQARDLLHLDVGQALTFEGVRRTLLSVHGSGLVSQAEVRTRLSSQGVDVQLVFWSNILVESVRFPGVTSVAGDDLEDLVEVRAGRPLVESRILRSVFELQDRFVEQGFLENSVQVDVAVDEAARLARVTFDVVSGPRASVGSIEFEGDLGPVTPEELRGAMRSAVGERYRPQRARDDTDALQEYLFERGFRTARVDRPGEVYDDTSDSMALTYAVEIGPLVEVEVVGADLRTLRREGLLPFLGAQGYDPALVVFSAARIRDWYQSRGHYDVAVDTAEVRDDATIQLTLTVEPGPRYELVRLGFEGNETFSEAALRARMATSERRFLDPSSGRLVDSVLAEDLRQLVSFYRLNGFAGALVGPEQVGRDGRSLELTLPISEGVRRTVGGVRFSGVQTLPEERLAGQLPIRPQGPFHPTLVDRSVNALRAHYRDEGFNNVLVSSVVEWDDERTVADVAFQVLEGPRTVVRRIVVRGQQQTSVDVLRRVIDLEPGDPVSDGKLRRIQRDLYRLGIFTQVEVELARGNLLAGERDVLVRLEEGDRHRLSLGGGYDTEDGFRGLFGYSLGNVLGRAASIHLDTVVSQREELYRLLVRQPALGNWRFPLTYSLFSTREEETAFDAGFDGPLVVRQRGLQIEATGRFETLRIPVIYTLKNVDNNAPPEISEALFDRENTRIRLSSLTTGLLVDRRDSPINPTRGRNTVLQAEYAFPVLGADEEFLKLFAQQTYYVNMGSAGVVGASLRLGGIESFRDPVTPELREDDGCRPDPIPEFGVAISERFFAGGRSTHRAYELDSLGVLGETLFVSRKEDEAGECVEKGLFPTGGNGLALFSLEYRYPLGSGLWATMFYDSGNVWADWRDIEFADFKDGVGVGVGWDSPIGPLRFEIGWKLDREIGEDPYQVFLSFGSAF